MRQSILVMRRVFRYVTTQYHDPFQGNTKQDCVVRAEKDVMIFPENPAGFAAQLGELYLFNITIYHDDGPERASFKLDLRPRLTIPQTVFGQSENIEPIITQK